MEQQVTDLARWRRIGKLVERMTAQVADRYALSKAEADVLIFLVNNPGLDTASDIVSYRLMPKASVSQAVEQLIQKGLLTRSTDPKDRRQVRLLLTDSANPAAQLVADERLAFEERMFAGFNQTERELYRRMNTRVLQNIEDALKEET